VILRTAVKPGEFLCLIKPYLKADWEFSCVASYEGCVARAEECEKTKAGTSVMIVQITTIAEPVKTLAWESILGEKIKGASK